MKKTFLSLLSVIFLALSIYALFTLASGIWLVARYENFDINASGFLSGELLFTALCLGFYFLIRKAAKKAP